ncbi:MAG: zinc ABC transporter solute-binding protein [Silicimonas sp.]|nr:zinc ABC transporter solute-binding protein [Silicimonas sp.]
MMQNSFKIGSVVVACATASYAQSPSIVTDIPPVHSLVSQVMEGVGTPMLLLEPGADPHTYALRPSQAAALENADVVIAIGPALTPWLEKPLSTLASEARIVMLLDVEGSHLLPYRGAHSHDHAHDDGNEADPHAWLDPANARVWLSAIADVLSEADPAQSTAYRTNAERADDALARQITSLQEGFQIGPFGVHHDAFQYFETRFGLEPAIIIQDDDAHQPGPARIAKVRAQVTDTDIACVFVEAGAPRSLVQTVLEGSDAKILELDPLGAGLDTGNKLYQNLLRNMVDTMKECR